MTLIHSILYLAAIGIFGFLLGRLLPKRLFKANRFPYRSFAFEKDGLIYQRLRISIWQARVPDMSRILPGFMPVKRMNHRPNDAQLSRMIQETCVAEFTHLYLSILGLGMFLFDQSLWSLMIYAVYVLLGNLPFMLIQRYNRPRLVHIQNSMRRRAQQRRFGRTQQEKRVLILSCNTGEGHNTCAAAIQEAFKDRGMHCDLEDGLQYVSNSFSKIMSNGHVWIYRHVPWLFRVGYRFTEQHPSVLSRKSVIYRLLTCGAEPLCSSLIDGSYDLVVCTHIFAAMMLTEVQKRHQLSIKTAFVATDYTGYPGVQQIDMDMCFIPDESLKRDFAVGSMAEKQIIASGIPVRRSMCRRTERAFARKSQNIPMDCSHLLIMCGSMGCGPIPQIVALLDEQLGENQLVSVLCGTNHKLKAALDERFASNSRVRIHGYVEQLSLLMDSADLYLTKPGGLSVTEAAAKNLPMVLINAVAGCEEYNKNFFLKLGLGVSAETAEGLARLCLDVLGDEKCIARMREAGITLCRGSAADAVCAHMLGEDPAPETLNPMPRQAHF